MPWPGRGGLALALLARAAGEALDHAGGFLRDYFATPRRETVD